MVDALARIPGRTRNKFIGVRVSLPFGVRPENGKEVEQREREGREGHRPRFAHTVPINNRKSRPESRELPNSHPANDPSRILRGSAFAGRDLVRSDSCRPKMSRMRGRTSRLRQKRLAAMIMTHGSWIKLMHGPPVSARS